MQHILVVNKHGDKREETRALLSRLGHETEGVDSPIAALAALRDQTPALVLLDLETGGLELCREMVDLSHAIPVIVTSAERTSSADRVAGLLAGADDYLCEPVDPDELLARTRRSLKRGTPRTSAPSWSAVLSPREREVLELLASGLSQQEISGRLVISNKTVSSHVQHILIKLGVHTQGQAIAHALRHGLV